MAQQIDSAVVAKELDEVIVRGYENNRNLRQVGASLNIIREAQLQKFSSNSVLQAINATPGVRMEERSPGVTV
jgi:iron complex outermembrane receptor protein